MTSITLDMTLEHGPSKLIKFRNNAESIFYTQFTETSYQRTDQNFFPKFNKALINNST